jgi:hypothetical protein
VEENLEEEFGGEGLESGWWGHLRIVSVMSGWEGAGRTLKG